MRFLRKREQIMNTILLRSKSNTIIVYLLFFHLRDGKEDWEGAKTAGNKWVHESCWSEVGAFPVFLTEKWSFVHPDLDTVTGVAFSEHNFFATMLLIFSWGHLDLAVSRALCQFCIPSLSRRWTRSGCRTVIGERRLHKSRNSALEQVEWSSWKSCRRIWSVLPRPCAAVCALHLPVAFDRVCTLGLSLSSF